MHSPTQGVECGNDAAANTDDQRRRGPVLAADAICIGAYILTIGYRLAVIPLVPALVATHPVLLEALRGSIPSLIAAGAFVRAGRASVWTALAAPLIGLTLFDPVIWWVGRRFGRRLLDHYARRGDRDRKRIARAERLFSRWGPSLLILENYLPVPNSLLYLVAGAAGMSLPRFVVFDLMGAALWAVPVVGAGYAIGQPATAAAEIVSHYSLWFTGAWIATLVAYGVLQWRRSGAAALAPTDAGGRHRSL